RTGDPRGRHGDRRLSDGVGGRSRYRPRVRVRAAGHRSRGDGRRAPCPSRGRRDPAADRLPSRGFGYADATGGGAHVRGQDRSGRASHRLDRAGRAGASRRPWRRCMDDVPGQAAEGAECPSLVERIGTRRRRWAARRRQGRSLGAGRSAARRQGPHGRDGLAQRRTPEERRTPRRVKVDRPRQFAVETLDRIEESNAYANLLLPAQLTRIQRAPQRDRNFVTELVYGTIRMRRACDWLVDRFVSRELDAHTRNVLRMGAYQLQFMGTPAYAVVSTSVELGGKASRLVEAVLRRVADNDPQWPDDATRLSYPDWVFNQLVTDLGHADAFAAMETMNKAPTVHERPDGYVQDPASQWVAEYVDAQPSERIADLCAAPGGKATWMAKTGALVAAG